MKATVTITADDEDIRKWLEPLYGGPPDDPIPDDLFAVFKNHVTDVFQTEGLQFLDLECFKVDGPVFEQGT